MPPRWFYDLEQHEQLRALAVWQISNTDGEQLDKIAKAAKRRQVRERWGV